MAIRRLFFCGGFYSKRGTREKEFGLVRPTGGKPYVCNDPQVAQFQLFPLTQHHSHLYELRDRTAVLMLLGDGGEPDGGRSTLGSRVDLTADQVIELLQSPAWEGRPAKA